MEEKMLELRVEEHDGGKRLDVFLKEKISDLSRSRVQELIETSLVLVNGRPVKPSYKIKMQDFIQVKIPDPKPLELNPKDVPFDIIYEDEHIAVINKPAGIVVHPAPGHLDDTLVHGLLKKLKNLSAIGGKIRPGIVHRLDKDTSGLMLVAKNDMSHKLLVEAFKQRLIEKNYLAILYKHLKPQQGKIENFIGRHPTHRKKMAVLKEGRLAITLYEVKKYLNKACLVVAKPVTGRTHQLRVHFSFLGHPILGDPIYGGLKPDAPKPPRLMLHAFRLKIFHPISNIEMEFEAPIPEDFQVYLNLVKK
ncbi:RluA family pseudouridine synthase [Thermodesulfobacterium hveragerdense]|uniref:RluA family pseudouridine synthase n=1 Tax=Thermodesulfobacterium hveragerdense TaxID=53424 RepID=UPI000425FC10|nr:RluA family pseudouridine synthase [Thermodesulfobacterium hveragerdense]